MKRVLCSLAVLFFVSGPFAVIAQSSDSLLVTTDTDCAWILDGVAQGN